MEHEEIMKAIVVHQVQTVYLDTIASMFTSQVRIGNTMRNPFEIRRGVRHVQHVQFRFGASVQKTKLARQSNQHQW